MLNEVLKLAREAGQRIMAIYDSGESGAQHKVDGSPLTEADLASHHAIVSGLEQLTPGLPILSEESAEVAYQVRQHWQRFWLIDPLDGTKEFIKRNGEFTVNIALIEEHSSNRAKIRQPPLRSRFNRHMKKSEWWAAVPTVIRARIALWHICAAANSKAWAAR